MSKSKCKGCGKEITWAFNPSTGKKVPLDMSPPFYALVECPETGNLLARQITRKDIGMSHFATCPKANDFSGKNS